MPMNKQQYIISELNVTVRRVYDVAASYHDGNGRNAERFPGLVKSAGWFKVASISNGVQWGKRQKHPWVRRHRPAVKRQASAIKIDPSSVKRRASAIKNDPSALKCRASAIKNDPSALKRRAPGIKNDPSALKRQPSAIKNGPSAIKNGPSAVKLRASAIKNNPSALKRRASALKNGPSAVKRQPSATIEKQSPKNIIRPAGGCFLRGMFFMCK